jgi:hypothetical protein
MTVMMNIRWIALGWAVVAGWGMSAGPAARAADAAGMLGGEYRADTPFPEFMPLWREGWSLRDENGDLVRYARPGMPLGGYLHAFIRNTSAGPLEIRDVRLDGVSLAEAIAPEGAAKNEDLRFASSVAFARLPAGQIKTLGAIGEPVWWKVDPFTVPAGKAAEIVVRLRRPPQVGRVALSVAGQDGSEVKGEIDLRSPAPRIVGIGFDAGLDRAYLYLRSAEPGVAPAALRIDGVDVTARAAVGSDRGQPVLPAVIPLDAPLREGEFHLFEAAYPDGRVARSGIRVDRPDFVYGMWGGFQSGEDGKELEAAGARYIEDLRGHNINTIMEQYGGRVRTYVRSPAGQQECARHGIRIMDHSPAGFPNQRYVFLHDEPDAKDVKLEALPLDRRIGTRGQWLVGLGRRFRSEVPDRLQLLNIDNTFRPENWYTYAQLPDIPCADPYFQSQLRSVYMLDPGALAAYVKPTYVYAAGAIYESACAPKPMHLILNSVRTDAPEEQLRFRPPTPEEKRVELYYSLAAGARGISFWWYTPGDRAHGVGSEAPEMRRLFAEMGLVGGEFGTAEPVLSRACPSPMNLRLSPMLWGRALVAGTDTVVLVLVNDNIAVDRAGTVVQPLVGARVALAAPSWLNARDTFEVGANGIVDIAPAGQGPEWSINLGRVELTRLIFITSDPQLRGRLKARFESRFAGNARSLLTLAGPRAFQQNNKPQKARPAPGGEKKSRTASRPA